MTDFDLKVDSETGQLYAEDPETGDRQPVPFDEIDVNNAGVESLDAGSVNTEDLTTTDRTRLKRDERNTNSWTNTGQQIHDFGDLSGWTVTSGNLEADTDVKRNGAQSAKLTIGTDDSFEITNNNFSLDLSDKRLAIAIRIHETNPNGSRRIRLRVHDGDGNSHPIPTSASYQIEDEEAGFIYNNLGFDDWFGGGETPPVDLSDIQQIDIYSGQWGTLDSNITVWVDGLRTVPCPSKGKIILDYDGVQHIHDYEYHIDVLGEFGYTPCAGSSVNNPEDWDWDHIRYLQNELGWMVRPHIRFRDLFDAGEASEDDYREELEWPIRHFQERGLHYGTAHLSFLGNATNYEAIQYAQEYALTGRSGTGPAWGVPANPMKLAHTEFDEGLSDEVQRAIDTVARAGGYHVLYAHCDDRLSESDHRDVLEYLSQKEDAGEIEVIRYDEAISEWEELRTDTEKSTEKTGVGAVTWSNSGTAQTIDDGLSTTVDWSEVISDGSSLVDVDLTNNQMTVNHDGTYRIATSFAWNNANYFENDRIRTELHVNGTEVRRHEQAVTDDGLAHETIDVDWIAELDAGDTVDVRVQQDSGGTANLAQDSGVASNRAYFEVRQL